MQNMRDLGLPQLIRVEVKNFSLYKKQPTFSYEFKLGINAILGINGIGKTTFIEMILYSLVGYNLKVSEVKKKVSKENLSYFKDRCDPQVNNSEASVVLEYVIKGKNIVIERSLIKDKIIKFLIDGYEQNTDEEYYNKVLIKLMGVTDFISAQKIIRTFLIFDEQRLNVAWEVKTQDEILKILLLNEDTQIKIVELERMVSGLDTKGRHKSEDRRIIRERMSILEEERKKISDDLKEIVDEEDNDQKNIDTDELLSLKNTLNQEIENDNEQIDDMKDNLNNLESDHNRVLGERNSASLQIEQVILEEERLETSMYKSIYEKFPDYYFTLEKNLINSGECLTCGTKDNSIKMKFMKRKEQHSCIICGSEIDDNIDFGDNDIEKMNELHKTKINLSQFIENKNLELNEIEIEIEIVSIEIRNLSEKIAKRESYLIEVESRITETFPKEAPKDTYELMIRNLNEEAEKLTIEINEIYSKRKSAQDDLDKAQESFVQFLSSLNSEISRYFNKYASTFLGVECELTIKQQTIRFIPHIKFMPKIAGYERESIYSVSESQRFFLDQAFRMAIIDFLSGKFKGFKTFFITETPEGSLDLAYEEQVAKMFKVFAESENNIIFTSNLNSSNFLYQIFNGLQDAESRILNMLEKGNPTKIQNSYKEIFEKKLNLLKHSGEHNE